jgi:hypothetical protein
MRNPIFLLAAAMFSRRALTISTPLRPPVRALPLPPRLGILADPVRLPSPVRLPAGHTSDHGGVSAESR